MIESPTKANLKNVIYYGTMLRLNESQKEYCERALSTQPTTDKRVGHILRIYQMHWQTGDLVVKRTIHGGCRENALTAQRAQGYKRHALRTRTKIILVMNSENRASTKLNGGME